MIHDLEHLSLGFNHENFIHEIFEPKFKANISECARAMKMKPNSLRDILYYHRSAGIRTLSSVYRYCVRQNIDPTRYIFIFTSDDDEEERKGESI